MAASLLVSRSLAKFSGLFINESRFGLTKSTKVCGSWHQSCYMSTDQPQMPKRPASSYFIFLNEKRAQIVAENPDAKMTEIGRKLGELYRALSDDEKKHYKEIYKESKAIYDKEMEKFKGSISADQWAEIQMEIKEKRETKKKRRERAAKREKTRMLEGEGKPKMIPTVYALFVSDMFKTLQEPNLDQCAEQWKKLSKEDKEAYKEKYTAARKIYDEELEKWKKEMIDQGKAHLLETPKKPTKSKKKKPKKSKKKSATKSKEEGIDDEYGEADEHSISESEDEHEKYI